jgi:hypothetical protein
MKDQYQDAVNRRTKDHAWLCAKKTAAAKAKIGTSCPCGHEIVGYESKRTGLIGAYCFLNVGTFKKDTPSGPETVERAQIQFTDHSQDPFWVDHGNIIRKG